MACLCACRQQGATNMEKPIVMEGTLQSPKLLAATHGESAPETSAAVSALGGAIKQLQRQLSSVYDSRCMVLPPAFTSAQLAVKHYALPTALQDYAEEILGPWLL